jgi:nucleoside-diphosphate-sugar epimerase
LLSRRRTVMLICESSALATRKQETMTHHLIVGAGPVGRHVAELLTARGDHVTVVSRSGRSTGIGGVEHLALDASDTDALSRATEGAAVLYNCANPGDYTQWERTWPPLAAALLTAAERTGATYAITGNLYPYGPVDGPMHEGLPDAATDHKGVLRATLWADALAAHDAGRVRAVEVRASDYLGPGIGANGHVTRVLPSALRGRTVSMVGGTDLPHTFTDVLDVARTLVAAAEDQGAHGRTWMVPSNAPRTQRQALTDVLAAAGKPAVPVRRMPAALFRVGGLVSPMMRELADLTYQWTAPYVVDDRESRAHFGIEPTPWDEVCRRTAAGAA